MATRSTRRSAAGSPVVPPPPAPPARTATRRDAKSSEITAFRPLLDLTGAVVTFDALLTQTDHAKFLVEEKGAHYIAVLKGNHPSLHALVKDLPWKEVPLLDRTRATAHGTRSRV